MFESGPSPGEPSPSRVRGWLRGFGGTWSPRDLLLLCLCPLVGLGAAYASERFQSIGYVLPGVMVEQTDVSGFSPAALKSVLDDHERAAQRQVVRARVGKAVFRVAGADVGVRLDGDAAGQAMGAGREGNILGQVTWRIRRWLSAEVFLTRLAFDDARIEEHLHAFERATLPTPTEGSVRFADGKVVATLPAEGETIDRRVAPRLLQEALAKRSADVTLPTVKWSPTTTAAAVEDAKRRFTAALSAPVQMFIRFPETEVGKGEADGDSEEEQQTRIETVAPGLFGPALSTRRADVAGRLELAFEVALLDKSLSEIRKRWERPAQNAQFVPDHHNRLKIEPSKAQWLLQTEAAAAALLDAIASEERRGVWELVVGQQPKVTTELAHQLNIKQLVSSFSTFHPCCKPRVENIHRIADLIDGTVVLPGETFSVNETLGPRTASNGFTMAPTIVKGEMDDTVGGGISQFATTLFNAVLRGGYEIIERQPHSIYFNRYPMGHEATLSYPKPDLVFRNDTQSGMVIRTKYSGTSIKVMVFGDNSGRVVTTDVSKPFDTVEPELEYLGDPTLPPDEEKVEEKGDYGFTVFASRTVREKDGTEHKETRKVVYKPRARRLVVHPCKIPEGAEGFTGEKCPELDTPDAG